MSLHGDPMCLIEAVLALTVAAGSLKRLMTYIRRQNARLLVWLACCFLGVFSCARFQSDATSDRIGVITLSCYALGVSSDRNVRISKLLSLGLRHDPSALGVTLDAAGWTDVVTVLRGLAAHDETITADELEEIVAGSDKQRFALSPDGARIRANQGHSVDVDLGLPRRAPPEILFHGTVARFVDPIRRDGLLRRARTHVHLSAETDAAQDVAQRRRGDKVVLRVHARAMHDAGHVFFMSDNGVWLTERVPPEFLDIP